MIHVLVLHGPNLDCLGRREPAIYGTLTLAQIDALLVEDAAALEVSVRCQQSNHEGVLIDALHAADGGGADAVVFNPAAYTHTSVALRDAVAALSVPVVEVHLSNPAAREPFRRRSLLAPVCIGTIAGFGAESYRLGLRAAANAARARRLLTSG